MKNGMTEKSGYTEHTDEPVEMSKEELDSAMSWLGNNPDADSRQVVEHFIEVGILPADQLEHRNVAQSMGDIVQAIESASMREAGVNEAHDEKTDSPSVYDSQEAVNAEIAWLAQNMYTDANVVVDHFIESGLLPADYMQHNSIDQAITDIIVGLDQASKLHYSDKAEATAERAATDHREHTREHRAYMDSGATYLHELAAKYAGTIEDAINWSELSQRDRHFTRKDMRHAFQEAGLHAWAGYLNYDEPSSAREDFDVKKDTLTDFTNEVLIPKLAEAVNGTAEQYPTDRPLTADEAAQYLRENYPRCAELEYKLKNGTNTYRAELERTEQILSGFDLNEPPRWPGDPSMYGMSYGKYGAMYTIAVYADQVGNETLRDNAITTAGYFNYEFHLTNRDYPLRPRQDLSVGKEILADTVAGFQQEMEKRREIEARQRQTV